MKELIFATNNKNKVAEIQQMIGDKFILKTLADIGCDVDIPENENTLNGNALAKALYVKENYGLDCFADDTGLEVEALDGEPGVLSARYAGEQKNDADNMKKLLEKLDGKTNRNAQFRTAIALLINGQEFLFEGIAKGKILTEKHGQKGFGYDPIFKPKGYNRSFAEMEMHEKSPISHRGKAVQKLVEFLHNL